MTLKFCLTLLLRINEPKIWHVPWARLEEGATHTNFLLKVRQDFEKQMHLYSIYNNSFPPDPYMKLATLFEAKLLPNQIGHGFLGPIGGYHGLI